MVLYLAAYLKSSVSTIQIFDTHKLRMKINEKKSKIMIFNMSKKYDFPPELSFQNGEFLEYLNESKLLGIKLDTSLKWYSNTAEIYKKSMGRMWLLRRMKKLNLEPELILDYYLKEIRPLTEQGVIVWNSGLTKSQVKDLEKIQKVALSIILGGKYSDYYAACDYFNISKLSSRREELCVKMAIKLYLSPRCDQFYTRKTGVSRNNSLVKENTT